MLLAMLDLRRDASSEQLKALSDQLQLWCQQSEKEGLCAEIDTSVLGDLEKGELPQPHYLHLTKMLRELADSGIPTAEYLLSNREDVREGLGELANERHVEIFIQFAEHVPPEDVKASLQSALSLEIVRGIRIMELDEEPEDEELEDFDEE